MNKLKLTTLSLSLAIALGGTSTAMASAFQLWEQDAGGIGDYHAGGAAEADSASTEWYNPAGMVRLKHKQISVGGALINLDLPFNGTVEVNSIAGGAQPVSAQGGGFNFVPNIHYVDPINDRLAFGIGLVVPFGLKTDYGNSTYLRYVGTETSLQSVDLTPALAIKINNKWSVGVGLDIVYSQGIFNQYAGLNDSTSYETTSKNTGDDFAGGAHIGFLYQESPTTRFGLAYHSKIVNHMKGTSKFSGPLADLSGYKENDNLRTDFTLPAWTELSAFHQFNKKWSAMASATYTQWSVFKNLVLKNVAGYSKPDLIITIPENYSDTWNFAVGAHYQMSNKWLLKGGFGYDFTPSNDKDRNPQLPDQNRFAVSTGVRYKIKPNLWIDAGYTHLFVKQANIDVKQTTDQGINLITTTKGSVNGSADVVGMQLTWNI